MNKKAEPRELASVNFYFASLAKGTSLELQNSVVELKRLLTLFCDDNIDSLSVGACPAIQLEDYFEKEFLLEIQAS
jgi:hypothetical protein